MQNHQRKNQLQVIWKMFSTDFQHSTSILDEGEFK